MARVDSTGDVLLAGPAVRAVARRASVTLLCGRRGREAAELLPHVDDVIEFTAPWIDHEPDAVDRDDMLDLVDLVAAAGVDEAIVLTSFHQSALPLALLLRMAGVASVAAISDDYPGSLLDLRHRVPDDIHEVERALSLVGQLGYELAAGDDCRLAVMRPRAGEQLVAGTGYVVVHPGAAVPARAWGPRRHAELVSALWGVGHEIVVTGAVDEQAITAEVAGPSRPGVTNLGGRTDLAGLAEVLAGAGVVVTGNTGPAHLAAAVSTPIVSIYAPTVPAERWRPWGVRHELLGRQEIECAGCRAHVCPVPGHPCVDGVAVGDVLGAVERLLASQSTAPAGPEIAVPDLAAALAGSGR
jgi:ADP-heptose:LPS heptosyltransferase